MRETKWFSRALKRFGGEAIVTKMGQNYDIKAIIQPMRYKNKMFLDSQITPIGTVDESCFLYLGPPDVYLEENSPVCNIHFNGLRFMVVKTELLFFGGQHILNWAILRCLQT